jgi:hypothetical protein
VNFDLPGIIRKPEPPPHVFIANDYHDQYFARKLATALRRDRISPFTETGEMTAGDSLIRRLASTTRPVDCVVPIVSVASIAHAWVEPEMRELMRREINRRRVRVYPAKADNCALPPALMSSYVADFHGQGWNRAYESLKAAIQHRNAPTAPVVHQPTPRAPRAAAAAEAAETPASEVKQVYLSYDHQNDGYYRDVLVSWSKMPGFVQLWVTDQPPAGSPDSAEAEPVKLVLAKRIAAASGLLCVVGPNSASDRWMQWEIKKADELGKRIIAVRTNRDCAVPELLSDIGATCAMSFTFEGIRRAVDEAYGGLSLD